MYELAATATTTTTELVLGLYAAVLGGDVEQAATLVADDVRLRVPGSHPLAGTHVGLPAILDFLERTRAVTDDGEHIEVLDVLAGEEHVALYCHVTATRPDRAPLDNLTVHLAHVHEGRITELTIHNRDDRPVDAFWS